MTLTPAQQKKAGIVPYDTRLNPVSPPSVGVFDEPTRPVCINVEWIPHIEGLLERLVWDDAWEGTDTEVDTAIGEIRKLMVAMAIGGDCVSVGSFRLQQNPENLCQLMQSFDGGNTYSLAFDYSLCSNNNALTTDDISDLSQQIENLRNQFDGSTGSIAPDMVYDATPDDNLRDTALCHAVYELVIIMCEMEIEYRRQVSLSATITAVILGLVGVAITVLTGATATPFYLAVASALAGGFGTIFAGLSDAILNDKQARIDVACCMKSALDGATISKTAFENSLDSCGFIGTDNNAQLAGAISQMLTQDDIYETFLNELQKAYRLAELGIADCVCDNPETLWEKTWDFSVNSGSADGWSPYGTGSTWINGLGWRATNYSSTQKLNRINLLPSVDINVYYVEYSVIGTGSQTVYSTTSNTVGIGAGGSLDGNQAYNSGVIDTDGQPIEATYIPLDIDPSLSHLVDRLFFFANPWIASDTYFYYNRVTIRGKGVNPFA